jgi:hypothetical protein
MKEDEHKMGTVPLPPEQLKPAGSQFDLKPIPSGVGKIKLNKNKSNLKKLNRLFP